jgi:hypothetical protein
MLRDGVKTRPEFTTLKAAFEKRFPDDSVAVAEFKNDFTVHNLPSTTGSFACCSSPACKFDSHS